jgi:DNA-binding GntR family transcriptional regulator
MRNRKSPRRPPKKRRAALGLPLAVTATNTIRDRIVDLTLSPGTQLDEAVLRDRLRVSRTPAREALNRLVTEGLVESRANRGFFVRALDLSDTAQFFDAYMVSERSSAYFCRFKNQNLVADLQDIQAEHERAIRRNRFLDVSQHNAAFHVRIAEGTENSYLIDYSSKLHNLARRLAYFVYANEADDQALLNTQQRHIVEEHYRIIGAIENADRTTLLDEMTAHAERFQHRISRFVSRKDREPLRLRPEAPPA